MNTDKIYAESIANQYAPKDTSKVVALRKLDARAKRPAAIFTYTFGVAAALLLGIGMCLAMKVIGDGSTAMMALGIVIGLVGIACMSINYPLYKKFLAKGKQKYAYEIMQLAKEISEQYARPPHAGAAAGQCAGGAVQAGPHLPRKRKFAAGDGAELRLCAV